MPRWLSVRNTRMVNFHVPVELFNQILAGMQLTKTPTLTEFCVRGLQEYVERLGIAVTVPGPIPMPKDGGIRLSLDEDSPLTTVIDPQEIVEATNDGGALSDELRRMLGGGKENK